MSRRRRLTYHHWLGIDDKIACSLVLKLLTEVVACCVLSLCAVCFSMFVSML